MTFIEIMSNCLRNALEHMVRADAASIRAYTETGIARRHLTELALKLEVLEQETKDKKEGE